MDTTTLAASRIEAEVGKLIAEAVKLNAETVKLSAETSKLSAETSKLNRERYWYPVAVGAGAAAALIGGAAALAKLFL